MIARVKICRNCNSMHWKSKKINPEKVKDFEVVVQEFTCRACEPKPFQGLVQLRGFDSYALGDYKKSLKKVKKVKNGFDLQFASSGAANSYAKWVIKRIPKLEVKRTRSHVTTKEGKKIYRPTVLLRKT